jgi:hypothetical protein
MASGVPNLLSVILRMDSADVAAIASIHLVPSHGGYWASFTIIRWIRSASEQGVSQGAGRTEYELRPEVLLDPRQPVAHQLQAVQESGLLGNLASAKFRLGDAASESRAEYVVKTHAGSDAERAEWVRSYGPNIRLIAFSSAVSGSSGAYARRQAYLGSILSMHQGPLLQTVPAEIARARGFVHARTQLCADRQTHARPQSALV